MTRAAARLLAAALLCVAPLAAQTPATLAVRVALFDDHGAPIAGAGVVAGTAAEVTTAAALQQPLARSDEDGVLAFDWTVDLSAPQRPGLLLAAPGRAALFVDDPVRVAQAFGRRTLDLGGIVLLPGTTLRGRVTDAVGAPLREARIAAHDLSVGWHELHGAQRRDAHAVHFAAARSGEDGSFELAGVPDGLLQVRVWAEGHFERWRVPVDPDERLTITLPAAEPAWIRGRVLDAQGRGVRTMVRAAYEVAADDALTVAATDGEGHFVLPRLRPTRVRVRAMPWLKVEAPPVASALLDDDFGDVRLQVADAARAPRLDVRAERADGTPITTFRVALTVGSGNSVTWWPPGLEWHDTEAGHLVVALPDPRQRKGIGIVAAPGCQLAAVPFDATGAAPLVGVLASLSPEAPLRGRVVDGAGHGLAGVQVQALPDPPGETSTGLDSALARGVSTDAGGAFTLPHLPPGPYHVLAVAPGNGCSIDAAVTLAADHVTTLQLAMPAATDVTGTVVLPAGCPAVVTLQRSDEVKTGRYALHTDLERLARVRADGTWVVHDVAAGRYEVVVAPLQRTPAGMLPPRSLGQVDVPQRQPLRIDARAALKSVRISGLVQLRGDPVSKRRLTVVAWPATGKAAPWSGSSFFASSAVAPDGSFAMPVPAGRYTLELTDLPTGQVLAEAAVTAGAGTVPLTAHVRRVPVHLAAAQPGGEVLVDHIGIGTDRGLGWVATPVRAVRYHGRGAELEPGDQDAELLLPLGHHVLWAMTRTGQVAAGGGAKLDARGHAAVNVTADGDLDTTIVVSPPPDLPER